MPRKNKPKGPGFYITKTGKRVDITWGAKISAACKGRNNSYNKTPEAREKFRQIALERGYGKWMVGKKFTEETKKKMSEKAQKGKKSRWYIHGKTKQLKSFYQRRRVVRKIGNGGKFAQQEWFEILQRYNFQCVGCGKKQTETEKLQVDHIIPIAQGGKDLADNIQPLCQHCNGSKGTKIIDYREKYGKLVR